MYLPGELSRGLAGARLGSAEQVLFQARRPPALEAPPAFGTRFFAVGLCLGMLFAGLGRVGRRSRGARIAVGILTAFWGFAVGFIGCFLVYAWMFTDHVVAHRNQNILLCAPWAIALVVLGVGVAMGRPG